MVVCSVYWHRGLGLFMSRLGCRLVSVHIRIGSVWAVVCFIGVWVECRLSGDCYLIQGG
jgi:hypothetical protein